MVIVLREYIIKQSIDNAWNEHYTRIIIQGRMVAAVPYSVVVVHYSKEGQGQ